MNRLKKIADEFNAPDGLDVKEPSVEEAVDLIHATKASIDNVVESYHNLFDSLNNLAERYKALYDELKLAVKFPNERDAEDVAKMRDYFEDMMEHFEDRSYLASIIGLRKEI